MKIYKEMKLFSAFKKVGDENLEEFTYATEYMNEVIIDPFQILLEPKDVTFYTSFH
jgi:hypothetical protein